MKVSIFKLIKWGFFLRDQINGALADDKKLSAKEMLNIYKNLTKEIDLPVEERVQKIINLTGEVVDDLLLIADDNKVSVKEVLILLEKVCDKLGYSLDKTGFDIPEINVSKQINKADEGVCDGRCCSKCCNDGDI